MARRVSLKERLAMGDPRLREAAERRYEQEAALVQDYGAADPHQIRLVPRTAIHPNPDQPRKRFDPEALKELAATIKARGILQPLLVKKEHDKLLLIAGERRWRASEMAGLETVPVIIRPENEDAFELAMLENLQRENLNPIEEAEGYDYLIKKRQWSQGRLAEKLGRSRTNINETLALTRLPEPIREEAPEYGWTKFALLELAKVERQEAQLELWNATKSQTPTVRQIRSRARKLEKEQESRPDRPNAIFSKIDALKRGVLALNPDGLSPEEAEQVVENLRELRETIDSRLREWDGSAARTN